MPLIDDTAPQVKGGRTNPLAAAFFPQGSKDFANFCKNFLSCSSPLFGSQVCCCSEINGKKIEALFFLSRIFISFPLELHSRRMTSLFFPLSRSVGVGRKKEVSRPFVWLEREEGGGGKEDMMHLMHTSIFRKQDFKGPYILLLAKKKAFPFKCSLKFTFYTLNFAESIFYSSTKCESTLYREEYKTKKERKALERVSCVIAHYTYPAFFPGLFPTSFLSHMTAPLGICVY